MNDSAKDSAPMSKLSRIVSVPWTNWFLALTVGLCLSGSCSAQAAGRGLVRLDSRQKTATLADGQGHLALRLNYDGQCVVDQVLVRGRQVIGTDGVVGSVCLEGRSYTTGKGMTTPRVTANNTTLTVRGIVFGKPGFEIHETWTFQTRADGILWRITRRFPSAMTLEDEGLPSWNFAAMDTWKGGILGNGGVVWNKYLASDNATYGTHTGAVTFWNPKQNDCLRIIPTLPLGWQGASRFSHQKSGMSFNYLVSETELKPNHGLNRFHFDRQDVWAPFGVEPGVVNVELLLQAPAYDQAYDRGSFKGLDGSGIREVMNTVGRYGVIDNHLTGANGWITGFICLHEQWFAQIGLALGDPNYTANLPATLDFERDHAIGKDGRVVSRWGYNDEDAMPQSFDAHGFYEARWGYLMDSQPDYVINVAEQFDLTGDIRWLKGQKQACEKALDYLIRREIGNSGLVSMLTESRLEKKGSDWFDIIWASYKNALVNSELYYALVRWADAEESLGDARQAGTYRAFAERLKASFNRPLSEGGFWDPVNRWYVYWRDKDGSVHGNNLFTPVNFTAIGYGLCDNPERKKAILDRIESEMEKEKLFFWPINFFTYQPDESHRRNHPFPNYENGAIFMSWGELGVRAYAEYSPALALKYVKQSLARYAEDGLSYQRYERDTQQGAGDDILAGNCMSIVGLYRDIYGVQPKPNRLLMDPHLTAELNGTNLRYALRGRDYGLALSTSGCAITSGDCTVQAATPFAVNAGGKWFEYFPGQSKDWTLAVAPVKGQRLSIQITQEPLAASTVRRWTESGTGKGEVLHMAAQLIPNGHYKLKANGKLLRFLWADIRGRATFTCRSASNPQAFELELLGTR